MVGYIIVIIIIIGIVDSYTLQPYNIKYQDVPEVVGYMEVEDYSSRAANLSWAAPYDGNSPITVYNIIYKTYRFNM